MKIAYHRTNYLFYIETQENGALQVNSLKHFCTPLITKRMLHHKNTPRSLGILNDSFFLSPANSMLGEPVKALSMCWFHNSCAKNLPALRSTTHLLSNARALQSGSRYILPDKLLLHKRVWWGFNKRHVSSVYARGSVARFGLLYFE